MFCGYMSSYKIDQIYIQNDIYSCLFQETLEKRNNKSIAQVLSYQYI